MMDISKKYANRSRLEITAGRASVVLVSGQLVAI